MYPWRLRSLLPPTEVPVLLRSLSGLVLVLAVASSTVRSDNSRRSAVDIEATVQMLRVAMEARISLGLNQRSGLTVPAAHCRHAAGGCERRLSEFARYLVEAGDRHGVDPWLMAAMAYRESGFNPFAMGSLGELGILQIHPAGPTAMSVRFMRDEWYRRRCRREPGACQEEVVDHAARLLSKTLQQCGGDVNDALGAYNTGRCGGNDRYSKRILKDRGLLLQSVGLPAPAPGTRPS